MNPMVPCRSVLNNPSGPKNRSKRSATSAWGCPNWLPAPEEITAKVGFTWFKKLAVLEVRLPWWPALSTVLANSAEERTS